MRAVGGAAAAACCALAFAPAASAGVTLEVRPLFGETCLPRQGTGELRVLVDNTGSRPVRGTLIVDAAHPRADRTRTRHAWTVNVSARSDVSLSVDTPVAIAGGEMTFRLVADDGRTLASTSVALRGGEGSLLLDATPGHRFSNAQHSGMGFEVALDVPIDVLYRRSPGAQPDVFAGVTCGVERLAGSDLPRLPRLAAGYRGVALVLVDSTALNALGPAERNSLASYLADGGALAVVVRSPNDLRHPTMIALVGEGVSARPLPERGRSGAPGDPNPWGAPPPAPPAALAGARSWEGGHLDPRWMTAEREGYPPWLLGASARYGRGFVHLLSWDPAQTASLEDPWSARTLLRVATRVTADRSDELLVAVPETLPVPAEVRRFLTAPKRSGRGPLRAWAVVAALAAGLVVARLVRRTRLAVPVHVALVLAAWAVLAREAARHRGALSHARTLAMLDVQSGFSRASGRRFHALDGDRRRVASIGLGHPERVVAVDPSAGRGPVTRFVGTDSTVVTGVGVLPWTPVIVREDGPEDLRGTVTLRRDGDGALTFRNDLPWALREVVLVEVATSRAWTFAYVAPGRARRSSDGRPLPRMVAARFLVEGLSTLPPWGSGASALSAVPARAPADVGDRLDRWFGRRTSDGAWDAAFAIPAVPGRADPWSFAQGGGLIARVDRPAARTRGGLRVAAEDTWLRVREENPGP